MHIVYVIALWLAISGYICAWLKAQRGHGNWAGQARPNVNQFPILSAANEQIPRLASATVRKYFFGVSGRAIRDTLCSCIINFQFSFRLFHLCPSSAIWNGRPSHPYLWLMTENYLALCDNGPRHTARRLEARTNSCRVYAARLPLILYLYRYIPAPGGKVVPGAGGKRPRHSWYIL